jgi:cell wall-associated NlpC family hydrolase
MPPAEAVLAAARSWLGVPYRHQSGDRLRGIDCVRLIVEVGRAVGAIGELALPAYRPLTHPRRIRQLLQPHLVELDRPQVGAVLLWGPRVGMPTHFGIRTDLHGGTGVIHADSQLGRVVEHGLPTEQLVLIDSHWWFR